MYQTVLVVSVFVTYLKRKNFAIKNIFDESAQSINFIELQFSNIHLFNILCDEMGTTRKALTWHSFFFFEIHVLLFILFIYLFIYDCVGSSFL